MFLRNDFMTLRALEPEDLEIMYRWENDSSLWMYGSTIEPYSRYAIKQYIANSDKTIYDKKQLRLMIELKDKSVVGCIDLFDFDAHNSRAGVGVLIDKAFQHRGYATAALELLCRYAFNFLNLHQLYAHIPTINSYSLKLFEKNGFTKCGLMRDWMRNGDRYLDVAIYQKTRL